MLKVDIRLIAATNKNLAEMIKQGKVREDLYFRLNVFPINLPALRERKEDIALIANYFLASLPRPAKLSTMALQSLIGYAWPGNVRELRNILEQASILTENGIIERQHLPALFKNDSGSNLNLNDDLPLDDRLNLLERELIIEALRKSGGVQVKAANLLGINQRSLWHRIKKLEINVNSIRNLQ